MSHPGVDGGGSVTTAPAVDNRTGSWPARVIADTSVAAWVASGGRGRGRCRTAGREGAVPGEVGPGEAVLGAITGDPACAVIERERVERLPVQGDLGGADSRCGPRPLAAGHRQRGPDRGAVAGDAAQRRAHVLLVGVERGAGLVD